MPIPLNSEVLGPENDKTILILHGLFGSIANWRSIARYFAGNYRVISLDLRNHGRSPWHENMRYVDLAGDVAAFLESNSIQKPHVIGHSMGGKTLMTLLQRFNIEIDIPFVIDIAPVKYNHDHDALLGAMEAVDLTNLKTRKEIDSQLAKSIAENALRQYLMQNVTRNKDRYEWRINLKSISNNSSYLIDYKDTKIVNSRIVFIRGAQSDYVLPRYHDQIHSLFPNAQIESIAECGHWLHVEKPGQFVQIIESWL